MALEPATWTDTTNMVNVVRGMNQVSVDTVGASSFYRLVYP